MGVTREASGTPLRVLFVSDTHLGFDLPLRPRVERRRRGPDFFACFERALEPARRGEADVVVHGGDLLYRSRVPASLVSRALQPAGAGGRRGGARASPARQPRARRDPLPAPGRARAPPRVARAVHGRDRAARAARGLRRVSPTRAACGRRSRRCSPPRATGRSRRTRGCSASTSASKAPPAGPRPGFTFRDGDDVVRASDLPGDVAVVLCGHVHRHQVLRRDLRGRPLPAPVVYAGSVERTSFAERDEAKGFVMAAIGPGGRAGVSWPASSGRCPRARCACTRWPTAHPPPTWSGRSAPRSPRPRRTSSSRCACPSPWPAPTALRAARLRALGPPTANVTVSVRAVAGVRTPLPAVTRGHAP